MVDSMQHHALTHVFTGHTEKQRLVSTDGCYDEEDGAIQPSLHSRQVAAEGLCQRGMPTLRSWAASPSTQRKALAICALSTLALIAFGIGVGVGKRASSAAGPQAAKAEEQRQGDQAAGGGGALKAADYVAPGRTYYIAAEQVTVVSARRTCTGMGVGNDVACSTCSAARAPHHGAGRHSQP